MRSWLVCQWNPGKPSEGLLPKPGGKLPADCLWSWLGSGCGVSYCLMHRRKQQNVEGKPFLLQCLPSALY